MRLTISVLALLLAGNSAPAEAIPAFARKYSTTCATCHAPIPRLTPMGERFAENGFEFTKGEIPRDTIMTGDPLLRLQRSVPFAVRLDAYFQALTKPRRGQVSNDQQVPWVAKILSGGNIAEKISYYFYFLASERGEVAGLEDAYVQFTDVASSGINVVVGQFQVSDPLFKRELRLHYEDYQPYRMRAGHSRADLAYDRGVMALWSPRDGTDFSLQVVNGQGLREASSNRQFDADPYKNFAFRLSHEVGPLRIGGFGYFGRESADGLRNRIRVYGPDMTLPIGSKAEINLQLLRREDSDPYLGSCSIAEPCPGGATSSFSTTADAAMAELIVWPQGEGGRWFVTGLFNWIDAGKPVISLGLGEEDSSPGYLRRYRTGAVGLHYVLKRNVRLMGESGWDLDREQARFVTGFSLAF